MIATDVGRDEAGGKRKKREREKGEGVPFLYSSFSNPLSISPPFLPLWRLLTPATWATLTWEQAQIERFSYILSNGYRFFSFRYARQNVIYKAKRK